MIIAQRGNFSLRTKTYIWDNYEISTHQINICRDSDTMPGSTYVVADYNENGDIVDCCNRLLDIDAEEFDDFKKIANIGALIIKESEEVKNGVKF